MEGESLYAHTQIGYVTVAVAVLVTVSAFLINVLAQGGAGLGAGLRALPTPALIGFAVVFAVLVVCVVVFSRLTIEIRGGALSWRFGPGVLRRSVPLSEIATVAVVRNPWYYGWGIRRTPHGPLYNVSGTSAVELTMRNGTRLRLGSDEPEALAQAISRARSEPPDGHPSRAAEARADVPPRGGGRP